MQLYHAFFTRFVAILLHMTTERDYEAYLLRLWRVYSEGKATWRASVEDAHTGDRKGFPNLDDLFDFLRQQTGTSLDSDESAAGQS